MSPPDSFTVPRLPHSGLFFGQPTPDGGLFLNKAERDYLRQVFERIDTAFGEEVVMDRYLADLPAAVAGRRARQKVAELLADEPSVMTVEDCDAAEAFGDRVPYIQPGQARRFRASLTIIRGGMPAAPAYDRTVKP